MVREEEIVLLKGSGAAIRPRIWQTVILLGPSIIREEPASEVSVGNKVGWLVGAKDGA
jgi:hypothetical protein